MELATYLKKYMMRKKTLLSSLFATLLAVLMLTGCSETQNISYFQDYGPGFSETVSQSKPITFQPGDKLSIIVTSRNPQLSSLFTLSQGVMLSSGTTSNSRTASSNQYTVLYTIDSSDASTNLEKASIALQQAQRSYDKTVDRQFVHAEVDGTVSSLKVAKGDEVSSGQEVAVIRDSSKMMLSLQFPAADAANFSVGQSADVVLDGTFESLKGTITAVTGTDDKDVFCLLVHRHGHMHDHLVIDEFVALGQHHIAVQCEHPAKLRRFKNIDALVIALLGVELFVHPDAVLHVRGVKLGKPKFHLHSLLMPERSAARCPGPRGRSCCSPWPWRTRCSSKFPW